MSAEFVNPEASQPRRAVGANASDDLAAQRGASAAARQVAAAVSLSPRDIQERIRKGASIDDLAELTGRTIDKLMPFAGPALDEREGNAARAQKALLHGTATESVALGIAIEVHFKTFYEDPSTIEWDSFRRPDQRWQVTATYATEPRSGSAVFVYDIPGNYITADNDDALWLVGVPVAAKPQPSVLPALEVISGGILEMVAPEPVAVEPEVVEEPVVAQAPAPTPTASKRKRPTVPKWDDIMFGSA